MGSIIPYKFMIVCVFWLLRQPVFGIADPIPKELDTLIQNLHPLPLYAEAQYSPLGRSPVVDAVLGDPFYLPVFGKNVAKRLDRAAKSGSLYKVFYTVLRAGGVPFQWHQEEVFSDWVPEAFVQQFGREFGAEIYFMWKAFLKASQTIESAYSRLSDQEKSWVVNNPDRFFFSADGEYDFFTTESAMPLTFFELASRVDFPKVADGALQLTRIVDAVYRKREDFKSLVLCSDFIWEEQGLKLIVSGTKSLHDESADFFIHLGGDDTFENNAGGTEGKRAAALFISLEGDKTFKGDRFVQGAGVLGVGLLASFEGKNVYKAESYSQAAGFFGAGLLMDGGGDTEYEMDFFGQSAAAFGFSLLWDKGGHDTFVAHNGMAQAASSTLGVAFLINASGNNVYVSGKPGEGLKRTSGIGQGGSIGVRSRSWQKEASFYGGVSFLYNAGGKVSYSTQWFGQGSAYFLGLGILVGGEGNNTFKAAVDSQGQGLHLAAGLLLKFGGKDVYDGGWGSIGTAGDESVGILIDTSDDDSFTGIQPSIGSSRKPKALGIFIDAGGTNRYSFMPPLSGTVQAPMSPLDWPKAFFLNLQDDKKEEDTLLNPSERTHLLFSKFPKRARVSFPFDPVNGWAANTAFQPLNLPANQQEAQALIQSLPSANYDLRRKLYETLDLWRFTHRKESFDTSSQIDASSPEDLYNWAILWALRDNNASKTDQVAQDIEKGRITSNYARKMALLYLGHFGDNQKEALFYAAQNDSSIENRALATLYLAKNPKAFDYAKQLLKSPFEEIKFSVALGLRNDPHHEVLGAVIPLLSDKSFYVRRAAALTAIAHCYKPAITILIDTFQYPTLDTTDNYGDNLFNELASQVGVNFGLDAEKWRQWWRENEATFEFPFCLQEASP